jgi:hypothetical protein
MGWETLRQIKEEAKERRLEEEMSPPVACPSDGTPLVENSAGVLGCTFCGYRFSGVK